MSEPVTFLDGRVQLWLGDAREIAASLTGIDCIVTSPPYNHLETVAKRAPSGLWADKKGGLGFVTAWKENGYADALDESDYIEQQNTLFAVLASASAPTASLFYNHQLRWRDGTVSHPVDWFKPDGWAMRSEIIWDRGGGMMFNARMFCRFDERILWFVRGAGWKWNQESVGLGTIWRMPKEQNKEHPVAYPEELPHRCISATTDVNDLVCDPYMGSGTSGCAAIKLGRRFVGIELEPKWFDLACRRIEDATRQSDMFIARQPEPVQEAML